MGRGGAQNAGPHLEDTSAEVGAVEEELPFPLTAVDRHNLSITDEQFQPHTWEELKQIIGQYNRRPRLYKLADLAQSTTT